MSSGTIPPPPLPAEPQPEASARDAFIEERLRRTRRQVKGVDIAAGLVILTIGTLTYLLAAVAIDHWVIFGGLGFRGRLLLLLGLLAGAGYYFARRVLMPLVWRINPIFAAYTIEQSRPSLKNSLINFLLLRGHRREVPQSVYRAVEHRAATDLSQIEIEAAVDRGHVIRLGYVLVAVVAVCGLYRVISPKNPFSSAARVLWPWSSIAAPTRVTIVDVKPGNTVRFHGEFATVSAEVDGLRDGETVALYYSTADGQTVKQKIPMLPEDGFRHQCRLPVEELGLQQDVYYHLAAGDYTTPRFTIYVQTAPTILVDAIEYDYPAYTGFSDRVVKRLGDVRAIEGTQVTIRAAANRAIQRATIDLGCNGLRELQMRTSGKTASGSFALRLDPHDPNRPEHDCYQLRFRDDLRRLNPRPTRHRIEVVRDLPPEIQLVYPQQEEVQLAEDGRLQIRIRAQDPDFALRKVVLRAESGGRILVIPPLLEKPHQGEFQASYLFEPARAKFQADSSGANATGLKAGERVRYWAEAEDNKQPAPGRGTTAQRWITIVKPQSRQPPPERPNGDRQSTGQRSQDGSNQPPEGQPDRSQQPQEDRAQDSPQDPQTEDQSPPQDDGQHDDGSQDQDPSGRDQPGQEADSAASGDGSGKPESGTAGQDRQQPSDEPSEPIDSETQPGDAIEKILEHRQQQQREQGEQKTGEQKTGEQKTGEQKTGEQKTGEQQTAEQQTAEQQTGEQQTGEQQTAEQNTGEQNTGEQKTGEQNAGEQQTAEQQTGEQNTGEQNTGEQNTGEQNTGEQNAGEQQTAEQQTGEQQTGEQQTGEQQAPEEGSPGAGEPSSDKTGSPSPQGENRDREKQPGEAGQNPGEEQQADSPSISRDQSDSQGDTSGDRSGGGKKGGGQRSNQTGTGAAGSQTEADDGGSAGKQQGEGQTGTQGGNQVETDRQTGNSQTRRGGSGSGGRREPGGIGPDELQGDKGGPTGDERPQQDPSEGGRPGHGGSTGPNARAQGNPTTGSGPGEESDAPSAPEAEGPGADDPNLEFARKATELALVHLKEQMEQDDSELLDRLGWSREEAAKFIRKWEQMKRAAAQEGPRGKAARGQLDQALKSLGLRPRGTRLEGDGTRTDGLRDLREAGRFDPPSDWSELFREYRRGVAGGGRR